MMERALGRSSFLHIIKLALTLRSLTDPTVLDLSQMQKMTVMISFQYRRQLTFRMLQK